MQASGSNRQSYFRPRHVRGWPRSRNSAKFHKERRMTHPPIVDLEHIERAAWADLARAAPAPLAQAIGLDTADIHHAFLFMASRIPAFQFNWLSGTGLNGGSSIAGAVEHFRAAGQHKFIIQIPPGPNTEACERAARAAGLKPHALA